MEKRQRSKGPGADSPDEKKENEAGADNCGTERNEGKK